MDEGAQILFEDPVNGFRLAVGLWMSLRVRSRGWWEREMLKGLMLVWSKMTTLLSNITYMHGRDAYVALELNSIPLF